MCVDNFFLTYPHLSKIEKSLFYTLLNEWRALLRDSMSYVVHVFPYANNPNNIYLWKKKTSIPSTTCFSPSDSTSLIISTTIPSLSSEPIFVSPPLLSSLPLPIEPFDAYQYIAPRPSFPVPELDTQYSPLLTYYQPSTLIIRTLEAFIATLVTFKDYKMIVSILLEFLNTPFFPGILLFYDYVYD